MELRPHRRMVACIEFGFIVVSLGYIIWIMRNNVESQYIAIYIWILLFHVAMFARKVVVPSNHEVVVIHYIFNIYVALSFVAYVSNKFHQCRLLRMTDFVVMFWYIFVWITFIFIDMVRGQLGYREIV